LQNWTYADRIGGLEPAVEVHRDTCTQTPEKTYALADSYFRETGKLLPLTWDFPISWLLSN
jgi:hypothetical protein